MLKDDAPPSPRTEWKKGAGVYVVPGTKGTDGKRMEPFVGRIVERCVDREYYMVYNTQRERAKKKGCRIHVDKITRLEQEGVSPVITKRVRHRDLSEGDKEIFRKVARQEVPPPQTHCGMTRRCGV